MFHYNRFQPLLVNQDDTTHRHADDDTHLAATVVLTVQPVLLDARQLRCLGWPGKVELGAIGGEVLVLRPQIALRATVVVVRHAGVPRIINGPYVQVCVGQMLGDRLTEASLGFQ